MQFLDTVNLSLLVGQPGEVIVTAVVLAVVIAPVVYRWQGRVRRYLRSLAWIALGFLLGVLFCRYALDPVASGQGAAAFTHVLAAFQFYSGISVFQ